jgi:hypothetical protein
MMSHGTARTRAPAVLSIVAVVDEGQIYVVVLGLAANTESPCLDTGKDDAHEFTKRGRIQRNDTVGATAFGILGVDAVAWD